jgi:hypothetical protein
MQKYFNSVLVRGGVAAPSANVTVYTYPGNVLATLYSDDGVTPTTNPVVTDANGYFEFYAANGRYSIEISGTGIETTTITDILLAELFFGSGAPAVSAAQGSLYLRSDGSTTNDRAYVNTDSTTNWTAIITAS